MSVGVVHVCEMYVCTCVWGGAHACVQAQKPGEGVGHRPFHSSFE